MERCDLFEQANLLFAGHTTIECIKALTLLSAHIFIYTTDSDEVADQLVDAYANTIKDHIRLNRAAIAQAKKRMALHGGTA